MSILIRGMRFPKTCDECLINCGRSMLYIGITDRRSPSCPLIELPPHGRLIDATFEENHYASMILDPTPDVTREDKHKARIILDALQMAKTVIEAKGSEE